MITHLFIERNVMKKPVLVLFITCALAVAAGCHKTSDFTGLIPGLGHTDEAVSDSVRAALESSGQFVGVPVRIEVQGGNVRLSGYVKTIRQSDVAADLATKVAGVTSVDNHLIVRK
jgi:hyperosmotically inducible periplasmic protein